MPTGRQASGSIRRPRPGRACAVISGSALAAAIALAAEPTPAPAASPGRADLLLVVDCMLPGQVRTLGQRSTYVSARRPARLTARDCQIRGGEYVAYDRADLRSALGAWMPLAEQGDVESQVIVGEIYERGMGVAPDYALAANWYRLAAEAGNRRAQVNLGHLYETGRGVAQDPQVALDWYRRAAGRDVSIELDSGSPEPAGPAESLLLESRTRELEAALAKLRAELAEAQRALGESSSRAQEAERRLAAVPPPTPAPPALPDRSAEIATLQQELARRAEDARALARELDAARRANAERQEALVQARQDTDAARAAAAEERRRLDVAGARLLAREAELVAQRQESERLGRALAEAATLASTRQAEIERLAQPAPNVAMAGPEVVIVEPALTRTRDIVPVATAALGERRVVGRVTAPAGIVSVTVNDRAVTTNEFGVFTTDVAMAAGDSPVVVSAVDRQGKRGEARFLLRAPTPAAPAAPVAATTRAARPAGVEFGSYHALVIGNNDYRTLPDLASPVNDATELARLLEQRYGFRTTLLLNADRYQILSALNTLRETLTAKDNLLIYYAGHGELDEVNQRGHWLPVDAERDSTANWIPSTAITDILNIMNARQILLVADSCYSGALTRSSVGRLAAGMTDAERAHWLRTMATRRSRTALTSGGLAPVMDAGGGRHSVFAKALLEVLAANDEILDGQRLHREVAARVAYAAANLRFDQVPEYAPIRFAGHEAGEFFLVPGS